MDNSHLEGDVARPILHKIVVAKNPVFIEMLYTLRKTKESLLDFHEFLHVIHDITEILGVLCYSETNLDEKKTDKKV